jgi:hypothetical protein
MNGTAQDNYPQLCTEIGLTCTSCTSTTARELAAVCKGLAGKMIGQMFVQIYPSSACAPMLSHFTVAYKEESLIQDVPTLPAAYAAAPLPARREVAFARPRAMRAVA